MNNKISINKFLDVGGLVEIRLRGDLFTAFGLKKFYFAANSWESARNMVLRLYNAEHDLRKLFHSEDIHIDQFVDSIYFRWNRILYELEDPHPPLVELFVSPENHNVQEPGRFKPYYLIAKSKCL